MIRPCGMREDCELGRSHIGPCRVTVSAAAVSRGVSESKRRTIARLVEQGDMTAREIAAEVGLSPATVKALVTQARKVAP